MEIAVNIIAYNEAEYIRQCIEQWEGLPVKVFISNKPWNNKIQNYDGTVEIAKKTNAEVIVQNWKTEEDQRNYSIARMYDYDWIILCDADEFYTKEDREKLIRTLKSSNEICYRSEKIITYWKKDYVLRPPDKHLPLIALKPKEVKIFDTRMPIKVCGETYLDYQPLIPITLHHFSWSKSDEKIREKIDIFSDFEKVKPYWYENVWLKWTPDIENVKPYGIEESKAVYSPPPQEIKDLIK
jgi:glycosyltransferase involved in cell wall biosynthesis